MSHHHGGQGLRAWRQEMNLSQEEAAEAVIAHATKLGIELRTTGNLVSRWERGQSAPSREARHVLANLTGVRFTPTTLLVPTPETVSGEVRAHRPRGPQLVEPGSDESDPQGLLSVESVRYATEAMLDRGSGLDADVEWWEQQVLAHGADHMVLPPQQQLTRVVGDFATVRGLLDRYQSRHHRDGLVRIAAALAGIAAIDLTNLGLYPQARAWFATGGRLADASGDRSLAAWLCVYEAIIPYYLGNDIATITLAERAQVLAGDTACPAAAMAACAQARALARRGDEQNATKALMRAEKAFGSLGYQDRAMTLFGFPERRLHFYSGGTWTMLGRSEEGLAAHELALELYPEHDGIDRVLIGFDQAACWAQAGDREHAWQVALNAVRPVPEARRGGIVADRARLFTTVVPIPSTLSGAEDELATLTTPAG